MAVQQIMAAQRIVSGGGGGYPEILSVTSSALSTSSVHAVQMPATVSAGDLLVMHYFADGAGTATTPAGWTSRSNIANAGAAVRGQIFTKTAAGTEGGTTVNVSLSAPGGLVARVIRIRAGTFGAGIAAAQKTFNSVTTVATNALTPPWGSAATLWLAFGGSWDNQSVSAYPYPDDQSELSNSAISSCLCSKKQTIATQPAANLTYGASTWGTLHVLAIQPV